MKTQSSFLLLLVILVALTMPVVADVPVTIQNLPAVIIGDREDVDEATSATLLRYVNIFNLDAVTNEPNSGDPSKLKFWYETTGAKLRVGTPLIKEPLTPAEAAALKAGTTIPPSAKDLTGGTAFWLSLIQNAPGAGKVSATNIATATAKENGATPVELAAANATGKHTVSLYVIDDVVTSKSWGQRSFDVYSLAGMSDAYSQAISGIKIREYFFENDGGNWAYLSMSGIAGFLPGAKAQTATAIGHTGASGTTPRFSSWVSPVYAIPAANMTNSIFVGTMSMSGTAATAAAAPGFRLVYADGYYIHIGGLQVMSPAGVTAFSAPYGGNNRTLKLVWAVPSDLTEYSDTGKMNKVFEPANDLRSYSLLFDLMQMDTTDSGNIMLENCLIQKVTRPPSVIPTREWGGTGTAFNTPATGWATNTWAAPGFGAGMAAISAANMTVATSGTLTGGWASLFPNNAIDATRPAWATGKMLRTTYKIASSDAALVPSFRMLTLAVYKTPVSHSSLGSVIWGDCFSYANARGRATPAMSPYGLPGAPKVAGSTVELYHASQYAGTGAEDSILTPQFDLVEAGAFITYPANGWARPSATLTVSSVKMEMLDQATVIP